MSGGRSTPPICTIKSKSEKDIYKREREKGRARERER
jgi:hypothetical protein